MSFGLQRRSLLALSLVLLASSFGCGNASSPKEAAPAPARKPSIVFMTDFGTANDAVAICKAVILSISPDARIMDITHQVTPFQIEEASRFLYGVTPYYPSGTVFLAVIDPGVGTSRKAVIVKSKKGQFFVLPDNGMVSAVIERDGLEGAREISNQNWIIQAAVSSTFHGRDIFSPAAAHLAEGWDYTIAGSRRSVRLFGHRCHQRRFCVARLCARRQGNRTNQQKTDHLAVRKDLHERPRRRISALPRFARQSWHRNQSGQLLQNICRRSSGYNFHSKESLRAHTTSQKNKPEIVICVFSRSGEQ